MALGLFPSHDARQAYVREEAREMLLFDLSFEDRRRMIASCKRRELKDFGTTGPFCSLLEPDVRIALNHILDSNAFAHPSRHLIHSPPSLAQAFVRELYDVRPAKVPDILLIGADGAQTPGQSRFDEDKPPIRFDSMLTVSLLRPLEHDNEAARILGGASHESKEYIEDIIDKSGVLQHRAGRRPALLLDGGGIYKFAPSKGKCDFCGTARSVLSADSGTTTDVRCTATLESFKMLVDIHPSCIVCGLLHGLCTLVLRIRKCGLTDAERTALDEWYVTNTGLAFVRSRDPQKRDPASPARDGKLEIEALDRMLKPVTAERRRAAAGDGAGGGAGGAAQEPPPKKRELERIRAADAAFEAALDSAWPPRWHAALRIVRRLREADREPDALTLLGKIHDDFERYASSKGWTVGCHFVAHAIRFALDHAGGDLRILHEQLVERQNQRVKAKLRHWSGDATKAVCALNAAVRE